MELRKRGYSYQQISDEMGISKQSAHESVAKYLAETVAAIRENCAEYRELELQRADHQIKVFTPLMDAGDYDAAKVVQKAQEYRAKLLGLFAPIRQEVTGKDGEAVKLTWAGIVAAVTADNGGGSGEGDR